MRSAFAASPGMAGGSSLKLAGGRRGLNSLSMTNKVRAVVGVLSMGKVLRTGVRGWRDG